MATLKELIAQQEQLAAAIEEARTKEVAKALDKIHTLIAEYDIAPEEVYPHLAAPAKRGRKAGVKAAKEASDLPIKYRHPENPDLTWVGRGKPPKWISEFEAAGGKREDCLVA